MKKLGIVRARCPVARVAVRRILVFVRVRPTDDGLRTVFKRSRWGGDVDPPINNWAAFGHSYGGYVNGHLRFDSLETERLERG
jgi:hypothetical protein